MLAQKPMIRAVVDNLLNELIQAGGPPLLGTPGHGLESCCTLELLVMICHGDHPLPSILPYKMSKIYGFLLVGALIMVNWLWRMER